MPSVSISITSDTEEEIDQWAITRLTEKGYSVSKIREWETAKSFCERIGITTKTLIQKMKDPRCPIVEVERGNFGKGRLKYLASNKEFEKYCMINKR